MPHEILVLLSAWAGGNLDPTIEQPVLHGLGNVMSADNLRFIADYQNFSSEEDGVRNQQTLEFGADWTIAPHRTLAFQTEFELDGDGHGTDFGAKISYIVSLDAPSL